ncbi:uncharacterized protein J7T54_002694 [Emericellopsis cladophorae]|uniref:Polyketide synthase n=1 Tax=Emericellopsis cladophorae TaxID=2686198 RepID=A0A9Q0B9E9_9HYPO|nr:uncharacterized protein J7T54_002694 [Emericellopsis cladophorae]KAI6777832.1 hypothetical protein J7T54_002694 [Emericellopsis cladophorae]
MTNFNETNSFFEEESKTRTVERHRSKVALICGDDEATFFSLNQKSNQFARSLRQNGVRRGHVVAVALDRSVHLVAMLLAVMKTGATYVPIDPALPAQRVKMMIADAHPKLVITEDESPHLQDLEDTFCMTATHLATLSQEPHNLNLDVHPYDLVYIMYTSGSTGTPKGVEVTHGSVANLLLSMKREPECGERDRLLALTTVSFDMAVLELFLPLLCGGTVVLAQRHHQTDPRAIIELIAKHDVNMVQGTPAIWQMLLDSGWAGEPRLEKVLCGGEALSRTLADRLLACCDCMWNMYGPTEATVYACIWKVTKGHTIAVGSPITNCRLYILDEDMSPVPTGSLGELFIAGSGVAQGIELGDVEAAINRHDQVSATVVTVRDERLVAYYIRKHLGENQLDRVLRPWLKETLPSYMIPAFFVELQSFPVTINGKIDRRALPDPVTITSTRVVPLDVESLGYQIGKIWSEILGHDQFGNDDNFFEIGGDSLRLVRAQGKLEALLCQPVPITKLFEHYTIKSLANYLSDRGIEKNGPSPGEGTHYRPSNDDIAIVSMACRLPGGVNTPEEFWTLLDHGVDVITQVPQGRWENNSEGRHCRHGGFISSIHAYDASFFGISPREARRLDPAQYLMLEIAWEAFERAGYTPEQLLGSKTGVYVGTSNILAHVPLNSDAVQTTSQLDGYHATGSAGGTISGRISYHFGLEGPTMTIDTACSSSLVTTHLACRALQKGDCDIALSGGVSLMLNPGLHAEFSLLGGMSPDGRCRSFSSDTQGTGWSEGSAAVVLKRLSDAQRDGDKVHAVIRGTAVNHDGRSATLTTPNGSAQTRLIRATLKDADLQPVDIDYVEAHGTGTKLGDPIEATAIAEVFGPDRKTGDTFLGEITAGHIAGVMDLSGSCRLVAARGRLMQSLESDSLSMISLSASASEVENVILSLGLGGEVEIALYNSPTQTVISGDDEAANTVASHFATQGYKIKALTQGNAFHSRRMDAILDDYHAIVESLDLQAPKIDFVSSVEGGHVKPDRLLQADYWVRQVREPVRFAKGMMTLIDDGISSFLEIGPRPILSALGAACLPDGSGPVAWLPSLDRGRDPTNILSRSASSLHERGVKVHWRNYFSPYNCRRVELPTYAFDRAFLTRPEVTRPEVAKNKEDTLPGDCDSVYHLQYEMIWQQWAVPKARPSGVWGLFPTTSTATSWTKAVAESIRGTGMQLIPVQSIRDSEGLAGLIMMFDATSNDVDCSSLRDLIAEGLQTLQEAASSKFSLPPIVWITNHAVGTGVRIYDEGMNLAAAPLAGLIRTVSSEHPELSLRLIDITEPPGGDILVAILSRDDEPECVVRKASVLVPRMKRVTPIPKSLSKPEMIRQDGAVIITGGLGDLGMRVSRWLLTRHNVRDLVLVSRKGLQCPGSADFVAQLTALGARVTVAAGDVSKPSTLEDIIAMFNDNRPLRGVFHAAGVSDSGVLSAMTPDRFMTTLLPKAVGGWALHEATKHLDLDVFFLFSSISGVMGMPGLANYAASNVFLDALSHARRAQGLPATSVAFGTWAGEGMASKLSENTLANLDQFGLDFLTPREGFSLMEDSIMSERAVTVGAALDLYRLQTYLESQSRVPPYLGQLLGRGDGNGTSQPDLQVVLSGADPAHHPDIILRLVRDVVARALGFTWSEDVDVNRPLQEIGIDSLTAVQTRNHLATMTGLRLSVNILFHHKNLLDLSGFLLSELQSISASGSVESFGVETLGTSVKGDIASLDMETICKGCLDSSITFENMENGLKERPSAVFLTGGTGFVGAFILHDLLKKGIRVYALVRANDLDMARSRLTNALESYDLWKPAFTPLLEPITGDISKPFLGLDEDDFVNLASRIDAICHSGGLVDWMRPLEDYTGPNIISAHEVLRLASLGCPKSVHLISTISTLPKHMGFDLTEKDQEYGYGTSKYIAERLVSAARWRGAKTTVYRLPYVAASASTGHFRRDRGDFFHNFISGCLDVGVWPRVDADMSAVLPVDYLARTTVDIMTADLPKQGQDYDFRNSQAVSCTDFFTFMAKHLDGESNFVSFKKWKQLASAYGLAHPTNSLARISAVLDDYTEKTAHKIFKVLPGGEHTLGQDDYPVPPFDVQFASLYRGRIAAASQ